MGNTESAQTTKNDEANEAPASKPANTGNDETGGQQTELERVAEPKVPRPNNLEIQPPTLTTLKVPRRHEKCNEAATDKTTHSSTESLRNVGRRVLGGVRDIIKRPQKEHDFRTVEIQKAKEATKLGIILEGGVTNPIIPGDPGIFIRDVAQGSPADGKLEKGDRILMVDGVNLTRVAVKVAIGTVVKSTGTVQFRVKSAPKRQKTIHSAMRTELAQEGGHVFTEQQLEEFQDAFSMFDPKGRGKVYTNQMRPLIRSLGHNIDGPLMELCMNELELTASRKLNFSEFVRLMRRIMEKQNHGENHALDAIRVFDDEQTGSICLDELREAFERMPGKHQMHGSELEEILARARPNQDGEISAEDFSALLMPAINLY